MFREMRRKKQALSSADCATILQEGSSGVLAVAGDDGYPYAVPLSYLYTGGKLYFHGAKAGHKVEALKRNPKASFCVVAKDQVAPTEYTTRFQSVIAFGTVRMVEDEQEKRAAIEKLAIKYAPKDSTANREKYIAMGWARLCVMEMTIAHLSGKEAIEMTKARQQKDQ